tara:strand:+ start:42 stop:551 length:510 start_codon:yes stop_codon:yes gene_type:complete
MRELNKEDQLKFSDGSKTEVIILKAALEVLQFGSKYVVDIQTTIDGYTHFLPSDGLIKKIKEENVDVGDKVVIEKVAPDDKYPYGYFNVSVVDKAKTIDNQSQKVEMDQYATGETKAVEPVDKGIANFEKQFDKPEQTLDLHELSLRVEALEKEIVELKKAIDRDKIPF